MSFLFVFSCSNLAWAGLARFFTLDGKLSSLDGTSALLDSNVQLKLQILNPQQDCILYEEAQTGINTVVSKGTFNIQVGSDTGASKRSGGDSGNLMTQVYSNLIPIFGKTVSGGANCTYNPTTGDDRYLRVIVTPSSDGNDRILSPNLVISSVPGAVVADTAESLQGMVPNQFLNVGTVPNLTQSNAENIFSTTNYPRLTSLLSVPPTNYLQNSANGAVGVPQVSGQPGSGLIAGQMWYDSVGNSLKYYDGSSVKTLTAGSSGVTSIIAATTAGNPLVIGGTSTNPTIEIPVATSTANGYLSLADWTSFNAKQPAGNYLSDLTGDVTATGPGSATATIASNAITTTKINNLAITDAKINDLGVDKITSGAAKYFSYKPNNVACANAQILSWDNTNSRWVCANDATSGGTVTNVTSANGDITVATGTTTPALTLNSGTAANQIVKLDGTAKLPAVDGSQLTNLPSAPVQSVAGRTGTITLANTDISGLGGAATKNIGTTSGTVAAGDDSRITGALQAATSFSGDVSGTYNATSVDKIKGKAVSASPTLAGQMLRYDGTNYTPGFVAMTDLRSSVTGSTSFASNCGAGQTLTYNSVGDFMSCTNIAISNSQITDLGTAATLNAGTGANNLVQLDTNSHLPAIDASALINLSASNFALGTMPISRGGTGSSTGSITGSGPLEFSAGGSNQNITLTPSGASGNLIINGSNTIISGNLGVGTTSPTNTKMAISQTSLPSGLTTVGISSSVSPGGILDGTIYGISSYVSGDDGGVYASDQIAGAFYASGSGSTSSSIALQAYANATNSANSIGLQVNSNEIGIQSIAPYNYFSGKLTIGSAGPMYTNLFDVNGTAGFSSTVEGTTTYANVGAIYFFPDISVNIRRIILTANATITLPPFSSQAGKIFTLTVFVKQDATGSRTVTFVGSGSDNVEWDSGTVPTYSGSPNKVTIFNFIKPSDESVWYGSMIWKAN